MEICDQTRPGGSHFFGGNYAITIRISMHSWPVTDLHKEIDLISAIPDVIGDVECKHN